MLNIEDSILVIIDVQEKLISATKKGIDVKRNMTKMAKVARILSIPVILTEQYPKGLGQTTASIKSELTSDTEIIEKNTFSAMACEIFKEKIESFEKKQVVIGGIETHICVLQTVHDLINAGYEVYVLQDCCSCRNKEDFITGIELMKQYGAKISCVEISLFEWLKTSKNPHFKEIQSLII